MTGKGRIFSNTSNLLNDLLSALTGGVISNSHSLYSTTDNNPNAVLSGDLPQFFTNDENTNYTTAAPKAFLNWVAFDNQLNMNSANSGVVQVPTITGSEQAQPLVAPEQIIQKDGYLYIYVSNESAQRVFFDNLVIHHNKGHLLEEDQYYPFGLRMAGISDEALPVVPNNYLYNGKESQQNEFSDGTGLEDYDYGFRGYDPQIARFTEQDPLTGNFATVSPYQYGLNDPVGNIDKDGLAGVPLAAVTITAKAINRMSAFSSFTSSIIGAVSQYGTAVSAISTVVNVAQIGGIVIDAVGVTESVGNQVMRPEDWYADKNGNLLFNANVHNQADVNRLGGGQYLGKTYKGYVVNGSGKESGFSGGKNGSVFLSDNLPGIDVVASMPRSAGAYGPYIPTNKEVIVATLFAATLPMGGEGGEIAGLLDMGDATLASMGSKALIRGGVNVLAQTVGNKIVHPHQSWVNSGEYVNIISALFSAAGVNFLTNIVYSSNFNLNIKNGFQSTFNGGIGTNQSAKAIVGGTVIGGIESTIKTSPEEYPGIVNYGTQFLSTVTEVGLGF